MDRVTPIASALLLCFGCSTEDHPPSARPGATHTYVEHVGPLLEARCSGCHAEEREDGPFALGSYQQAWAHRFEILDALVSPAPEEGACPARPFAWTEADRTKVRSWARSGAPLGDPSEFAPRSQRPASR